MPKKFIRRNWTKASRLGKGRKSKQVWRAPKGRHSKTRRKRKGYPIKVMIGFKQENKERNLINKQTPVMVNNIKELGKIGKGQIAIIGKVGMKKKIEFAKLAKEKGISIHNLNIKKTLKKEKKKETKAEEKKK